MMRIIFQYVHVLSYINIERIVVNYGYVFFAHVYEIEFILFVPFIVYCDQNGGRSEDSRLREGEK